MSINTLLANTPRIGNALRYWFSERPRSNTLFRAFPLNILTSEKTIERIIKERLSIARFGDGELDILLGSSGIAFQNGSKELQARLLSVLKRQDNSLLVCLPSCLTETGVGQLIGKSERYWRRYVLSHLGQIVELLPKDGVYGDAFITRPYITWRQPHQHAVQNYKKLKEIWNGRNLLVVEGNKTRLGVGNDLFAQSLSIRRILAPGTDAFSQYNAILRCVLDNYRQNDLVLLALGPTATVLAAELAEHGIQALDVGHVDIEYCWFKMGVSEKVAVPGKYTNEVENGRIVSEISDDGQYISQVLARIE